MTKRQILPAGLWVVATPIGNLADISFRARQALTEADVILCEDTRRTTILLRALDIEIGKKCSSTEKSTSKRLVRLDAHASEKEIQEWAYRVSQGDCRVALVSDAGTPGVSDPGAKLVSRLLELGVRVVPIPGPSAVSTLLSVAGMNGTPFAFRGFFPRSEKEQKAELQLASESHLAQIIVWFESPLRVLKTFSLIQSVLPDVVLVVGKELTKIHEKVWKGKSSEVFRWVENEIKTEGAVGEWCFALEFLPDPKKKVDVNSGNFPQDLSNRSRQLSSSNPLIRAVLEAFLRNGISVSDTSREVSQIFGIPRKVAYTAALEFIKQK